MLLCCTTTDTPPPKKLPDMKKLLLSLLAAFAVTAVSAQIARKPLEPSFRVTQQDLATATQPGIKVLPAPVNPTRSLSLTSETEADPFSEPVYDRPAGRAVAYKYSGGRYYYYSEEAGRYVTAEDTNKERSVNVVYADNGSTVWMKGAIPDAPTAWIVGSLSDDGTTITVPQGQVIGYAIINQYYQCPVVTASVFYDENGQFSNYSYSMVDFKIDGDKISCGPYSNLSLGAVTYINPPAESMGVYYPGWSEMEFTKTETQPVNPPAGLEVKDYLISMEIYGDETGANHEQRVKVGIDGSDIYIGGLVYGDNAEWIKGTLDGGKATFKPGQLICSGNYWEFLMPGEQQVDDEGTLSLLDELTFTYDEASGTLATDAMLLLCYTVNGGTSYYSIAYNDVALTPYVEKPAVPAAPVINYFFTYTGLVNSVACFLLPSTDTDGHYIDPAKLYYKVYFDGKPYTFTKENCPELDADMEEVPYDMDGIISGASQIYKNGAWSFIAVPGYYGTIGVQAVYYGGGERNVSGITYLDNETSGISAVDAGAHGGVVKTEYFTLAGVKVDKPQHGIYVKTVTYADGTRRSVKVAGR